MADLFETKAICEDMLGEIAELERLCFSLPWSETSLRILCSEGGVGFAVCDTESGRAVAYGGMLTVLDEAQITNIAVHPDYRRIGLGKRILRRLLGCCGERGITSCSLEVRESNSAARALYSGEGFSEVGRRKNFYSAPREDAVIMIWKREDTPSA